MRASGAGFSGNGCVGDVRSCGTSLCGTGPFFDAVDWCSRDAIEEEEQSDLVQHGDGGNGPSVLTDVDERSGAGQIGIPDVMVNHLKVPEVLTGVRVGGDETRAEEIVTVPITAVTIP